MQLIDKVGGARHAQLLIKEVGDHQVHALRRQKSSAVVQGVDVVTAVCAGMKCLGWGKKVRTAERTPAARGRLNHLAQYCLVAEVHAVKGSQSEISGLAIGAAARLLTWIGGVDFIGSLSPAVGRSLYQSSKRREESRKRRLKSAHPATCETSCAAATTSRARQRCPGRARPRSVGAGGGPSGRVMAGAPKRRTALAQSSCAAAAWPETSGGADDRRPVSRERALSGQLPPRLRSPGGTAWATVNITDGRAAQGGDVPAATQGLPQIVGQGANIGAGGTAISTSTVVGLARRSGSDFVEGDLARRPFAPPGPGAPACRAACRHA